MMWVIERSCGNVYFSNERVGQLGSSEVVVLEYLIENLGQLKEKGELLDFAWPQKIVSPNSLTVAIKNIRKVFSVRECALEIRTHHGKGYSLHGDVSEVTIVDEFASVSIEQVETERSDDVSGQTDTTSIARVENEKKLYNLIPIAVLTQKVIIAVLGGVSLFMSSLIWGYDKKIYCEDLYSGVTVCGTKILYEKNKKQLKTEVESFMAQHENRYSLYVYGYNYSPKNFSVYPVL